MWVCIYLLLHTAIWRFTIKRAWSTEATKPLEGRASVSSDECPPPLIASATLLLHLMRMHRLRLLGAKHPAQDKLVELEGLARESSRQTERSGRTIKMLAYRVASGQFALFVHAEAARTLCMLRERAARALYPVLRPLCRGDDSHIAHTTCMWFLFILDCGARPKNVEKYTFATRF